MITIWLENEYSGEDLGEVLNFDYKATAELVVEAVLRSEGCPYDADVSLVLTGDREIHEINLETRGIDRATDVLSFPAFQYETPSGFDETETDPAGAFDPETGALLLGDIMISVDHVRTQAEEYGHSTRREYAFLVAHSMLHLLGYDHMTPEEEQEMFARQEAVLASLGILREGERENDR